MMKLLRRTMAVTLVCSFAVASVAPVMSNAETLVEAASEQKMATEIKAKDVTTEAPEKKAVKGLRLQATANVANVTDYLQLETAMKDVTITEINIMNDINFSNYTTGSEAASTLSIPTRSLTINGNGNTVDFRSRSYLMSFGSNKVDIVIKNIQMFGRNSLGPVCLSGTVGIGTQLTYQDIEYVGSQLTRSYEADVNIIGRVTNNSVNSYMSPFDSLTYETIANQVNLEITNINFYENSTYTGSTENATVINLKNNGTATVGKYAEVRMVGGNSDEEGRCAFEIEGNLNLDEGAFVQVRTGNGSTAGGVKLGSSGSSLHVSENAELMINTLGPVSDTSNPIYIAAGASLKVDAGGRLNIHATNSGTSTGAAIYTGDNSSFIIAKDGMFEVDIDGTSSKNLIRIGNASTFQFVNAKRVNLQLNNTNADSRLIYMSGTSGKLDASIQSVKAWTGMNGVDDRNPTYFWNPMYVMDIKYSGANVSSITATSTNEATKESFTQNFQTQNFKRVLFEGIPGISIYINDLTNNKAASNSHIITGVTNPGAYVKLSGDPAIPAGTIVSQDVNDSNRYHAIADSTGKYSFTLPAGCYVSGGNQVTAYTYLSGQSVTASTIVKNEVPPDAPTLNAISDKATTVTGEAEANSTVTVYKKADNTILATGKAGDNGHYSIVIPVSERPITPYMACYAVATNAASITSEHSADVIVTDTTKPTATAVTQYVAVGDTFTTDAKNLLTEVYDNAGTGDDNLTYTIDTQPDLSKVGHTMAQATIRDRAGNTTTITVPIFVKDTETVSNEQAMIQATDITILVAEYPTNEAELDTLIKTRSGVKAWAIPSGDDITSQVTLDKMDLPKTPGKYTVRFFVNGVQKQIEVTIHAGSLSLGTATENISFGEQMITSKAKTVKPINDIQLVVNDTRGEGSNWRLNAQLESPLQTANGKVLEDVLAIQTTESETALSTENAIPVYTNDLLQQGLTEISLNSNEASLVMNVKPGTAMANKEYSTNVRWTLEDAP